MKNMATNQKLILLMLMTAFLVCWVQGVSHGGGAAGAIGGAVGTAVGAVGTALGAAGAAVGTTLGVAVGILADVAELTVGVVGLTVELTASIALLPAYGIASDIVVFPNGVVGIVSSNHINLWAPDKLGFMTEFSYSSPLSSIAFHPGGGIFASGSEDSNIQLWNLQTERLDATLQGHTSNVLSVAFSPDGSLLASGGADGTVRLWNPATETLQATLEAHLDSVLSVTFSPDGSLLASGGADGTVRLWNPVTETLQATLETHMDSVLGVAFSPDGSLLASASTDGLVGLWDPHTETLQATLGHESPVLSVDFSPDGNLLASGSTDETARLWDPHAKKVIATLGHGYPVGNVAFSPDGSALITSSEDGTVRQWTITISPDGIRDTSESLHTLTAHRDAVNSVAFSPDGQTLVSGSNDNTVRLWNAKTGAPLRALTGHERDVNSVAFSPDGQTLASGSGSGIGGSLHLWNADTGVLLRELTTKPNSFLPLEPEPVVNSVAFSPDGQTLVSGEGSTFSSFLRLWDVNTGALLREFTTKSNSFLPLEPEPVINSVAFSPDGQTLASGGEGFTSGGFLHLRDANTGVLLHELITTEFFTADDDSVNSVAFSPDGQTLASGSDDNTVRLWNVNTGGSIGILEGHERDVNSVAFSPDGQTLASGSSDNTVRLWDANTGELLRALTGPGAAVNSVAFSPDGQMIAGGSSDNTVHLWEITPNTTVSLLPASVQSPAVGKRLTLNINITGGFKVAGYQATVQFDTTALRYLEGVNGDYLLPTAYFVPPVVDGNGVTLNATSLAGDTNGDGTLATLTFEVVSAKASTLTLSEISLVNSTGKKTHPKVEGAQITEPTLEATLDADVNGDGIVDTQDLAVVQDRLGQTGSNSADVNGDGIVDIADLTLVAGAIGDGAAAPSLYPQFLREFTVVEVKLWLFQAQRLDLTDPRIRRGIFFLEQLLAALIPQETTLLPNYPNPFNPETWIPYRLAEDAFVTLTIYDSSGQVVRTLDIGHRVAAFYASRSKAIYWDGCNEFGEEVASGVYFYHLSAGDFSATRRMLILK